jgi:hypothetical protein
MKKSRFTESQIVSILHESESGQPPEELIRKHGIRLGGRGRAMLIPTNPLGLQLGLGFLLSVPENMSAWKRSMMGSNTAQRTAPRPLGRLFETGFIILSPRPKSMPSKTPSRSVSPRNMRGGLPARSVTDRFFDRGRIRSEGPSCRKRFVGRVNFLLSISTYFTYYRFSDFFDGPCYSRPVCSCSP